MNSDGHYTTHIIIKFANGYRFVIIVKHEVSYPLPTVVTREKSISVFFRKF